MNGSLIRKGPALGGSKIEARSGRASSFWESRAAFPQADFTCVSQTEDKRGNGG